MANVVVVGGAIGGLCSAMLLAGDGHEVTVLERDPGEPPANTEEAWAAWERKGVNQFRMLHLFLPRFREIVERELPAIAKELDAAGALRSNIVANAPEEMTGGVRPGDERFEVLTGRRPVVESAISRVAAATPGVTIRRGTGVSGLLTGPEAAAGIPHAVGVVTEGGEELRADLVVDATGRRSPLPRWLAAIGARPPHEELEDCGFVYYGRHFQSTDGSVPPALGPLLQHYDSVSILTLPADNGAWGVGFVTSASDSALRALRDTDRWTDAVARYPLVAHWLDGEPLSDRVDVMAKIEDRIRGFVVDGVPVATGVLAVADSWACTNPSVGRGASIGLLHAVALRDLVRTGSLDDPLAFALAWDEATQTTVTPWYRETLSFDRRRLGEIEASINGVPYQSDDPGWEIGKALEAASSQDPDVLRAFLRIAGLLSSVEEVFSEDGMLDKVISLGAGWRDRPAFGPSRSDLLATAAA